MATTNVESDRVVRVNIRLNPRIKDRLDSYAAHMGMPTTTVAAFAIAQFLDGEARKNRMTQDIAGVVAPQAIQAMQQILSTPEGIELLKKLEKADIASGEGL